PTNAPPPDLVYTPLDKTFPPFLPVVCPRMGLDSVFAVFMLEDAAVAVCLRLEAHLFPHTRDASLVDDEKHVDARDRLRWQFRRPHTELSVVSVTLIVVSVTLIVVSVTLPMKRQL